MTSTIRGSDNFDTTTIAFFAVGTSTQTFGSATWTKIAFQSATFNVSSAYSTSTYRFQPTTAGYYQINSAISANDTGAGGVTIYNSIYKNGVQITTVKNRDDNGQPRNMSQSAVVYLNGSTDYIELYGYISGGTYGTAADRTFSGCLLHSA